MSVLLQIHLIQGGRDDFEIWGAKKKFPGGANKESRHFFQFTGQTEIPDFRGNLGLKLTLRSLGRAGRQAGRVINYLSQIFGGGAKILGAHCPPLTTSLISSIWDILYLRQKSKNCTNFSNLRALCLDGKDIKIFLRHHQIHKKHLGDNFVDFYNLEHLKKNTNKFFLLNKYVLTRPSSFTRQKHCQKS